MIKTISTVKAIILTTVFGITAVSAASPQERDAWNAARMLNTKAAYQSFMESYPTSEYAQDAAASMVGGIDRTAEDSSGAASGSGEAY